MIISFLFQAADTVLKVVCGKIIVGFPVEFVCCLFDNEIFCM